MTALGHLRMLDLSRQLPGPYCSTMLADLGMDVLSISAPGDVMGLGISFLARNKRSMTLNLKAAAGRAIFHRLAATADVVLEGARPGVMARLGADYETLRALNPRLIYCSITGYGQDGPYRDRVGHDVNYLGYAGVLDVIGEAGRPPAIPGVQIADIGGGALMATVAILAAVIAREQTGRGQAIDVAMLDGAMAWNVYHLLLHLLSGRAPARGAAPVTGGHPCYNVYETRDGRHLTLGAYEAHFWATLCRHFGREDFVAAQWDEGPRREEMFRFFRDTFRTKTLAEWVAELEALDICFGPVRTVEEALDDPQLRHRRMIVEAEGTGRVTLGSPFKLSETPGTLRTPPPALGEHTDEVLHALGFGVEDVRRLRAEQVV